MRSIYWTITTAFTLLFVGLHAAKAAPRCENSWDALVVEMDIQVAFASSSLNNGEFFDELEPRITGKFGQLRWRVERAIETYPRNGQVGSKFCLELDDIEDIQTIDDHFVFWLGPRAIGFRVPELTNLAAPILRRGSKTNEDKANVVYLRRPIELEKQPDPDWVAVEVAKLVKLPSGQTALNLKAFHQGKKRSKDTPIELYATNTNGSRCASTSQKLSGQINLQQVNGEWLGSSTDIAFGVEQVRPVSIEDGPCGELDVEMSLGMLPALNGGDEILVSFVFADLLSGPGAGSPFWEVFHGGGAISFSGRSVWPERVWLSAP